MLIGFGVSQFGGVVTSIGEKIGLSDVTLDNQGSGDDTRVTIGGTMAAQLLRGCRCNMAREFLILSLKLRCATN